MYTPSYPYKILVMFGISVVEAGNVSSWFPRSFEGPFLRISSTIRTFTIYLPVIPPSPSTDARFVIVYFCPHRLIKKCVNIGSSSVLAGSVLSVLLWVFLFLPSAAAEVIINPCRRYLLQSRTQCNCLVVVNQGCWAFLSWEQSLYILGVNKYIYKVDSIYT